MKGIISRSGWFHISDQTVAIAPIMVAVDKINQSCPNFERA